MDMEYLFLLFKADYPALLLQVIQQYFNLNLTHNHMLIYLRELEPLQVENIKQKKESIKIKVKEVQLLFLFYQLHIHLEWGLVKHRKQ